ncbi:MAG: hypothetical protein MJY85_00215 [Fibrobacter sp.]|nr:hypothetical protein [Fibrobacter sp.]
MKKTLAAVLVTSIAASASVAQNQELIESKVDSINAKRGLEIGGSIRAVAQSSSFSTDQDPTGKNKLPSVEKGEFVTGDLVFGFRPYENVRANATLRLEGGMQEYFAAAAKSVSASWLNIEGNIGNSVYWVVGDFRQEYSPLTLFSPGLDIMYEPQIFARKRYMAQKEQLLEGNQRNLQGANIQFRQDLSPVLGQVRAEAIFARLNRTAVLDLGGAEGNILPKDEVWGASQASNTDKWLAAGNIELLPFNKTAYFGVTPMYVFDNEKTYSYTYRRQDGDATNPYEKQDINPYELNPQNTMVISARAGADIGSIMGSKNLILDGTAEFAMSMDKAYKVDSLKALDDGGEEVMLFNFTEQDLNGMALLVNLNVGYQTDKWGVKVAVDGVYNDSNWFNNLAQSPSFFAQRILNSDKDGNTVKYAVNSPLYSTFDALYNFNPKFSPVTRGLGTNDDAFRAGQTNSYSIANYNKNSWTTNVYTRNQLALLETLSDPALQMSLPNGLATSNRAGARATLTANYGEAVEFQGMFSYFQQVSGVTQQFFNNYEGAVLTANYKPATYMEFGAGAKVDVFKLLGFSKPLEISGSYKHSERTLETDNWVELAAFGLIDETTSLKSDFINAGLYVQYLPRLGVNLGFQMVNTEMTSLNQMNVYGIGYKNPMVKSSQMQWMAGLDYNIAPNAWLAINFGMVSVSNDYNTTKSLSADGTSAKYSDATNLPDYISSTDGLTGTYTHKFSQTILEASINVEF